MALSPFPLALGGVTVAGLAAVLLLARWFDAEVWPDFMHLFALSGSLRDVALTLVLVAGGLFAADRALRDPRADDATAHPSRALGVLASTFLAWWLVAAAVLAAVFLALWAATAAAGGDVDAADVGRVLGGRALGAGAFLALGFGLGSLGRTPTARAAWAVGGWALLVPAWDRVIGAWAQLMGPEGGPEGAFSRLEWLMHATPLTPWRRIVYEKELIGAWMFQGEVGSTVVLMGLEDGFARGTTATADVLILLAWVVVGFALAFGAHAWRGRNPAA